MTAEVTGLCEVLFDGTTVWSFLPRPPEDDGWTSVPWPDNLRPWLNGVARVEVRTADGRELDLGEIRFGAGEGRVRLVDEHGIPVVIDKWGIAQRPFAGRGEGVTEHMLEYVERIISVLSEDCGIDAWIAFGTLLGAAREGGVIRHDSDIDLAFLSDQPTPAGVARDMFRAKRALTRAGMRVINKTGSFVTVSFRAPDGAMASIDLYACFYVGDLLHETATVRAPVPREAILPLKPLLFEGRLLPAPADPDTVLTASYGEGWRVPDPSFRHEPGPDIVQRFDQWFGNVMRQRRGWEAFWRDSQDPTLQRPSEFARWVADRLGERSLVVDVGAGSGRDARLMIERGHLAIALDFARGSYRGLPRGERELVLDHMNLYDPRDAITRAALLARRSEPKVVYARALLESLAPQGIDSFWRFLRLVMRSGGHAFLEFAEGDSEGSMRFHDFNGRLFPVDPEEVEARILGLGGMVTEKRCDRVSAEEGGWRWRLAATWSAHPET